MRKMQFTKMVATGNDFIVIDARDKGGYFQENSLARFLCERKTGVGADGVLVLEKSRKADFRMRIFNADGSVAEMCGNGLRCAVLSSGIKKKLIRIETMAGIYEASIAGKNIVKIKMEDPKDLKIDFPIKVNSRSIKVNYIDMGVPHTVIFAQGLDEIDVERVGPSIRYHEKFKPRGTNVDFVEFMDEENIKMRTYERGIEGETLACGTGAVAAAVITRLKAQDSRLKVNVHARGGVLKVYFKKMDGKIKDIYLEGEAREVFKGAINFSNPPHLHTRCGGAEGEVNYV